MSRAKLWAWWISHVRSWRDGRGRQGPPPRFRRVRSAQGSAVFWLHGTPGARRQIPVEARAFAERENIRLIGIDRPGIGSSTPHLYENVLAFADDLEIIADTLGVDQMAVVGLSGGGPFTLACRVRDAGSRGRGRGARRRRPGGRSGGDQQSADGLGTFVAPVLRSGGAPSVGAQCRYPAGPDLGVADHRPLRASVAGGRPPSAREAGVQGDVPRRPAQRQPQAAPAPFADIVVFARDWGFRVER